MTAPTRLAGQLDALDVSPDTAANVLDRAALAIARHGHHRGGFAEHYYPHVARAPHGALCVRGAIRLAVWGDPFSIVDTPLIVAAEALLAASLKLPRGHLSLAAWNDARARTKAEAIAALRVAAVLARTFTKLFDSLEDVVDRNLVALLAETRLPPTVTRPSAGDEVDR